MNLHQKTIRACFFLDNVIITPHLSAWSPRYMNRAVDRFIDNMKRFLNNEKLLYEIDFREEY